MFDRILTKLHAEDVAYGDRAVETRRKFLRHESSGADVIVAGQATPLRDWSLGGALFDTLRADHSLDAVYYEQNPSLRLTVGDEAGLTLRFHLLGETIEIPVTARILRMGSGRTVARFLPLDIQARRKFAQVLDLENARGFLESQKIGANSNNHRAAA